tara:strand:- start:1235 stop:2494 length:1260 start_codon:yes stop_codon:yes gene_type:complete
MSDIASWVQHGVEMRRPLLVKEKLSQSEKIVIVGGGLSGMCNAFRIAQKRPQMKIILVEKSNRLGGVISTWSDGEWICDLAVNATRAHPAFWRLVEDLGLSQHFKPSRKTAQSRWVLLGHKKHRLSALTLFKIGPIRLLRALRKAKRGGESVAALLPHKPIADALTLGIVNTTSEHVDADFLMPSLTQFGPSPPLKRSSLKRRINASYPLFTPEKGSVASLEGGMESLTSALHKQLKSMDNVTLITGQMLESPQAAASQFDVPLESVLWTAPVVEENRTLTKLSVFAVGFRNEDVAHIKHGYGTLIPDSSHPMSGILHESDLHHSKRAPDGHRLFRIMVPHSRWDGDERKIIDSIETNLSRKKPSLFQNLGVQTIPSYPPGYMQELSQKSIDCSYVGWGASGVSITHVVDEAERVAELF